ncbi:unnamed protein product [Caenorhabditis bovis]|uniref:Polynucleotide adenylyltransferase n=1 Tax=Caenorhabditis bovis TaxID=2654633 RepID=A0A8S1F8G1_9PELO|nr:unnamed protein product [Caenorhabditis bovis]
MRDDDSSVPQPSTSALLVNEEKAAVPQQKPSTQQSTTTTAATSANASTTTSSNNTATNTQQNVKQASTSANYYKDIYHDFGYGVGVPFAPWRRKRYTMSIEGLHEEIIDLYHWIKPNALEAQIRRQVFEKVYKSIKNRWKDKEIAISMFGSLRTSLFLPSSDIDILVQCTEWEDLDLLLKTAKELEEDDVAVSVSVFGGAHVPIVKLVEKDTRLSVDISFNTLQGVRAADYIEKVKFEFPIIEPLVLLLKQFLHYRKLNQTFTGGLSSYGLILLIVHFLQTYELPMRRKQIYDKDVNFGALLLRFFEVYSQEFNYEDVGISISQMRYVPKTVPGSKFQTPIRSHSGGLSLEDPLLSSNDVGRSTFNFAAISNAFGQALQILMVAVSVRDRRNSPIWHRVYKGSMLHLIMPFTSKEVAFRNWLKGGTLSYSNIPIYPDHCFAMNTLLSPIVNLKHFEFMRRTSRRRDTISRPLKITDPQELEKAKQKEKEQEEEAAKKLAQKHDEKPPQELEIDDTEVAPPMPTSTASVTTSATMSTTASGSERDDTDSPPLSSVVGSSDDEATNPLSKSTQVPTFKKPFSEVVASNSKQKSSHSEKNYSHTNNYYSAQDYAGAVQNKFRGQSNRPRERKSSRHHSQGSNDSSVNGYPPYRFPAYSGRRGRTSSNSSSRSHESRKIVGSVRSTPSPSPKATDNGNNRAANSQDIATTSLKNRQYSGYADAVKNMNGNSPNRVAFSKKEMTTTAVATPVALTNGNAKVTNGNPETSPTTSYRNALNGNSNGIQDN